MSISERLKDAIRQKLDHESCGLITSENMWNSLKACGVKLSKSQFVTLVESSGSFLVKYSQFIDMVFANTTNEVLQEVNATTSDAELEAIRQIQLEVEEATKANMEAAMKSRDDEIENLRRNILSLRQTQVEVEEATKAKMEADVKCRDDEIENLRQSILSLKQDRDDLQKQIHQCTSEFEQYKTNEARANKVTKANGYVKSDRSPSTNVVEEGSQMREALQLLIEQAAQFMRASKTVDTDAFKTAAEEMKERLAQVETNVHKVELQVAANLFQVRNQKR